MRPHSLLFEPEVDALVERLGCRWRTAVVELAIGLGANVVPGNGACRLGICFARPPWLRPAPDEPPTLEGENYLWHPKSASTN